MDDAMKRNLEALGALIKDMHGPLLARRDALRAELAEVEGTLATLAGLPATGPTEPAPAPVPGRGGRRYAAVLRTLQDLGGWTTVEAIRRRLVVMAPGVSFGQSTICSALLYAAREGHVERRGTKGSYEYRSIP